MRSNIIVRGLAALLVTGCSSNHDTSGANSSAAGTSVEAGSPEAAGAGGTADGPTTPYGGRGHGGTIAEGGQSDLGGASSANAGHPGEGGSEDSGGAPSTGGRSSNTGGRSSNTGGASSNTGGTNSHTGGTSSNTGGTSSTDNIGTWTDAPGTCPAGTDQIDITSVSDLEDATRGEGRHEGDLPSVCYLIHDGTYEQSGSTLPMYVTTGGSDATHRRIFVGQSRSGVVINGRAAVDRGASHVQISNLTFDLTGYSQDGSFNTLDLSEGSSDVRIDHVTFTGDCQTGANGGHIEVNGSTDVVVEACVVENFGRCGPNGHQDHGIYLANGSDITIRNNDIRGNASRGILFNTQGGEYGTLDDVTIERNRIHDNGHSDYEDGIAMNATDTGTISNVVIQRNLIYTNYYSGVRVVGDAFDSIVIGNNTFYENGADSSGSGRSELNLDDVGSGARTSITRNIIVAAHRVLNDCYDAGPRDYVLTDNVVQGTLPTGEAGSCISDSVEQDPRFVAAATGDFHTQNAAVGAYGAYAP
ncbi:MAG: right-handed parallel beta-helix repeat-containing protein [Polyangiaceae bacterium]|nr:right-handed parallel beta-helix repeat-containing protein [Polyangiaceae bacterium]